MAQFDFQLNRMAQFYKGGNLAILTGWAEKNGPYRPVSSTSGGSSSSQPIEFPYTKSRPSPRGLQRGV